MIRLSWLSNVLGYGLSAFFLAAAVIAIFWTPSSPYEMNFTNANALPSISHGLANLLGTDLYGRSILSRLMLGVSNSLQIVVVGLIMGFFVGVSLGLWFGSKRSSTLVANFFDFLTGIPTLVFAMLLITQVENGKWSLIGIIAVTMCTIFFRVTYLGSKRIYEMPFVKVSFMMGKSRFFVVRKHIFPNLRYNLFAQICPQIITCLAIESGLNYLGLGLPLNIPSLGGLIHEGQYLLFLSYGEATAALLALLFMSLGIGIVYLHLSSVDNVTIN